MIPQEVDVWNDLDWNNLLDDIADQSVIPILGSELLVIDIEGERLPLYRVIAERLAERLSLQRLALAEPRTINDVVCQYVEVDRKRNTPDRIYARLHEIFELLSPEPPVPLTKLAEMVNFRLYVTTTPDNLMERALNNVRFNGIAGSASWTFSPSEPEDLPTTYAKLECPTVYHLLGKLSKSPDQFVASDEDLLEFFYKLQGCSLQLRNLFDALGKNHLLFLGGSLSDWLARFFLRTTKQLRLSKNKGYDLLAANRFINEPELVLFLRTYSEATRIHARDPIAFVDELHKRWLDRNPRSARPATPPYVPPPPTMPPKSIFISYASEDRDAVRTLKAALDAAGLTVWFDKDQLMAGDDWDYKIQKNLRHSILFIPVISNNTEKWLHDVYFRAEWNYAETIMQRSALDSTFVVPVSLDRISSTDAHVPERFRERNFEYLPEGKPTAKFIEQLRHLVAENSSRPQRKVLRSTSS